MIARETIIAGVLAVAAGCGERGELGEGACESAVLPVEDQRGIVGEQLEFELCHDAAGPVDWRFEVGGLPDLPGQVTLSKTEDGCGALRWTPTEEAVGEWVFRFFASEGGCDAKGRAVTIVVEPAPM
ncbi:MAG: hypothetical protein AAF721_21615 [Myxococcota bacterium]